MANQLLITQDSKFAEPDVSTLFGVPDTDVSNEKREQVKLRPVIGADVNAETWEFLINNGPHWTMLNETSVSFEAKIVNAVDGSDLKPFANVLPPEPTHPDNAADDEARAAADANHRDWTAAKNALDIVAPINGICNTLFKSVRMQTPTQTLFDSGQTQPFQAHIHHTLHMNKDALEGRLAPGLWTEDTAGFVNAYTEGGFVERVNEFKTPSRVGSPGTWVTVKGNLTESLFSIERPFVNYVDLRIILTRASDDFVLMNCNTGNQTRYKLLIKDLTLTITRIMFTPALEMSTQNFLTSNAALYPIRRLVTSTFTVPSGSTNIRQKVHNNIVPKCMFFTLIREEDFRGNQRSTPFNYNMELVRTYMIEAGARTFPDVRVDPLSISTGRCKEVYWEFLRARQQSRMNIASITFKDFCAGGKTIFGQAFTNENRPRDYFSLIEPGATSLYIDLHEALTENLTLVVVSEFENIIKVNGNRDLYEEFKPM